MPKIAKALTATEVKRKAAKKGFHAVGVVAGLHLQVSSDNAASWILRTMIGIKRCDIGLGGYPDVTLKMAREKARLLRDRIKNDEDFDPIAHKKKSRRELIEKQQAELKSQLEEVTFDYCAEQCHLVKLADFRSKKHGQDWINSLEKYASPKIGPLLVKDIEVAHVMSVLEPIWHSKTETATRVRQRIESVLAWATVSGYREGDNPAKWNGLLEVVLPNPTKLKNVKHHAALDWVKIPEFMQDLRKREGTGALALEFLILTAARSGEVRFAVWGEIDFDNKLWNIPAERMKAGKAHTVPLTTDAIKLLKNLPKYEDSDYIFTAPRGGVLSDATIAKVLKRMKIEAVPHGFRSSFKDWARSNTAFPDEVSELALAHVNSDKTRNAYARDKLLPKRTKLMNAWAKYINKPQKSGDVVSIGKARA